MPSPLLVVAHLLLGDPPPDPEAECKASRKAREAPAVVAETCRRAFEAIPEGPGDRRTGLLATAHAAYKQALSERPDSALACADVGMLRSYAAQLAALPPGERPGDRADVATALEQIDGRLVANCDGPIKQEVLQQNAGAPAPTINSALPPAQTMPRQDVDKPRRPRRVLRVAGGTVLGVGLGAGLAMVGAFVRGAELRTRAEALHNEYSGFQFPMDISLQYDEAINKGLRANHAAIGFGVSAAILTATGVALLVADKRGKSRRVALSPLMLPVSGVRFAVEF